MCSGRKQQQLTLSSFFKKKTDSDEASKTSDAGSRKQESPFFENSRPDLEQRFGYDPKATIDTEQDEHKKRLHARFVEKFGVLAEEREIKRQRLNGETTAEDTEQMRSTREIPLDLSKYVNQDNEEPKSERTIPEPPRKKWSPLELQVLELKQQHPGILLVIEVGYKFCFFGEDAKVASRILHIAHFIDRNFYVASIPFHRLSIHIRRLVSAGHKVGVVRQVETAALKAAGSNRAGPFRRELKQLYTKGTFVDEMTASDLEEDTELTASSNYLMCVVEEKRGGGGPDELVKTGIIAVQPATGDIIYDAFEDGYMRSELETRLLHIEPCELLLPHTLSKPTEKLIKHITLQRTSAFGEMVRIERLAEDNTFADDYNDAFTYVSGFYTRCKTEHKDGVKHDLLFAEVLQLPDTVIKALAATIKYLSEFGLEHVLQLTKYFLHFSSRNHMLLNGNTIANLEIYRNSTDYSEKGSLFWVLNHTVTRFGKRLLKRWIGRPLVDVDQLNIRINAVDELLTTENAKKQKAQALLKQLPDLEKGLCRIHYGRSSPAELIQVLDAFLNVSTTFYGSEQAERFGSELLNNIFDLLPTIRKDVMEFRNALNAKALSSQDCKIYLFQSEERWPEIPRQKKCISEIETQLESYLEELKTSVKIPTLKFVHVAGIEYLLEVKNSLTSKVPQKWIKISGTKAVSRFHTSFLIEKLKEREQHRESLVVAAETAYRAFLSEISDKYESLRDVVLRLGELDCLLSLAVAARQPNYVKPTLTEGTQVKVVNGRHPMVERFLGTSYVANDVDLDADGCRTLVLTGPNMGGMCERENISSLNVKLGKSSYIRQVALISILGQIGSYVPADSATLGILDAVYTRQVSSDVMGATDNMLSGESTFMVELHEASDIMKQATERSLVILDELGRGTSTHDGMAIAYAVLHHFITKIRSITLFVTHYPFLGEFAVQYPGSTRNAHMSFIEDGEREPCYLQNAVVFLYKLVDGLATRSYGLNVARLANLPRQILDTAKAKSEEMESMIAQKTQLREQWLLRRSMQLMSQEDLDSHIDEIKQILSRLSSP
ncbi:Mismatch repair protein msh3 [Apophysomyces ossiformis]|uniref:DNA mismatch repair protein MSH3 n=1 Tax=Apophysomyces ossiformis TaxID=679940 RepID=A0A8H7BI45_9FUNG|nr:Mismatch repair protein msh3 [Apophysomyces ossiformis]